MWEANTEPVLRKRSDYWTSTSLGFRVVSYGPFPSFMWLFLQLILFAWMGKIFFDCSVKPYMFWWPTFESWCMPVVLKGVFSIRTLGNGKRTSMAQLGKTNCKKLTLKTDSKVYITNQDMENLFRHKHSTPMKFYGLYISNRFLILGFINMLFTY